MAYVSVASVKSYLQTNKVLFTNATSLLGTTAVTSVLGFVYWWAAARTFPPEAVGLASAAISAMTLLGNIGVLGLGTLLIGELSRHSGRAGSLTIASMIVAGVVSAVLGVIFALASPLISHDLIPLSASPLSILIFAVGVVMMATTLILDQALIGLLRGELQLARNTLFAVVKLGLLYLASLWFTQNLGVAIYATWMLGNVISLAALAGYLLSRRIRIWYPPQWGLIRGMGRSAMAHHALNLILQAPSMLLPLVVTAMLSARVNASFYAAWMVAAFVFVVPGHLSTALYAIGAKDPMALAAKMRTTLKVSTVLAIPMCLGIFVLSGPLLHLFGADYAAQATWCLRLLGLGVLPLIIKNHYVTLLRIEHQIEANAAFMLIAATLEVVLPAIGIALGGLTGLGLAWLLAVSGEALLMSPRVFHAASLTRTPPTGMESAVS